MKWRFLALILSMISSNFSFGASPPKDRIPYPSALKIAQGKCPGKVTSTSIEDRDGVWIYTFVIHAKDQTTCWIEIDAITGKIIKL